MKKPAPVDLSIERFENGDVDGHTFSHTDHVYVAWLYVKRYDLATAIARFDAALSRIVIKLGAENKYHKTVTWFFLLFISERIESDQSWPEFCRINAELIENSKHVLSRYYSKKYLNSSRARSKFLLPDKLARSDATQRQAAGD